KYIEITLTSYVVLVLAGAIVFQDQSTVIELLRKHFVSGMYVGFVLMCITPFFFGLPPFTRAYAARGVSDRAVLESARFKRIPNELALFWASLFAVAAGASDAAAHVAILAFGFIFTSLYPRFRRSAQ